MNTSWTQESIDSLCEKVIDYRGKTPPKVEKGVKLVTAKVIKNGRILDNVQHEYVPEELYDEIMRRGVPQFGDVLITTEAPLGEVAMIKSDERIALAQRVILLRANKTKILPEFLYMTLRGPIGQGKVHSKAQGTTVLGIKNPDLRSVELPVPPILIQEKIVRILSAYDSFMENNLKRIKLLEELARLTYEQWFIRREFPDYEQVPVDTKTGLPEGWSKSKLGDLMTLNYGKALKADDRQEGNIPVYGSAGEVGFHNESIVEGPGIIVGRKGNVGSVFWTDNHFFPIDTVFYITSDLPLIYLYFQLQYVKFINSDAAVPGLNRNSAYLIKCNTPPIKLMEEFASFATPLFATTKALREQNQLLKEARDILLPRLMTGMININKVDLPQSLLKPKAA